MSDDQDDSQKTEDPTRKRLEDAREKGQIPTSREVNSFMILGVFTMIVLGFAPSMMMDTKELLLPFIEMPEEMLPENGQFQQQLIDTVAGAGVIMVFPAILAIFVALGSGLAQSGFNYSFTPLAPQLDRISVLKGIKRMFSMRTLVEFLKGILKITVVGVVAFLAVTPDMDRLELLPAYELMESLAFLDAMLTRLLMGMLAVIFLIAVVDYMYQRYEFFKGLRMTKQEVKDEYRQQEGDPMLKQRVRAIRMERSRKRMMANVPTSDVVITNPTHYAVALKYDSLNMAAPILVAKGADKVAARIRELAQDNKVIIMRNPPLARALFDNVEVDEPIPQTYFKAVAEIIAYVYKLKGKALPGAEGGKRKGPENLDVSNIGKKGKDTKKT